MGTYSINDCGTAHEAQLLELYDAIIKAEKTRTGKEPTSLEKTNINAEVAEAYQSILNICKDVGKVGEALVLLKEKANDISVNEISKIAVEVVSGVQRQEVSKTENNIGNQVVAAAAVIGAEQLVNDMNGVTSEPAPIALPDVLNGFDTPEIAEKYDETSRQAEAGDENAQKNKGLINYALDYLRIVDNDEPKGKSAMVLTLIKSLTETGDPAALSIAEKLSEQYQFNVFGRDENGNQVLDEERLFEMYRERMQPINPKAANRMISLLETKGEYLIAKGKESPRSYEENLRDLEDKKRRTVFSQKYNRFIRNGEFDKAEEFVRQNLDIAKAVLDENVERFGEAQAKGNKKFMAHLQNVNSSLSKSVAQISRDVRVIDASKVDVGEVVASVNTNPKSLIPDDDREL